MVFIKNEYEVKGDYVIIKLKRRGGEILETLIDLEDLERAKSFNITWYAAWAKNTQTFYTKCSEYMGIVNGKPKYKTHYLHRFIIDANKKDYIDHINHNTLDNRKNNLRVTTNKKNLKNRKSKNKNNTSGYRNVTWDKGSKKWIIQLKINNKITKLGEFDNVHEAGKFAEEMREKYYGEYKGGN